MPTFNFKVQGRGFYRQQWSALVGGTFAWECVDDSDTTTHDSDTSYLEISGVGANAVSFPIMAMAECVPESIDINVAAKEPSGFGGGREMSIGFYRGGAVGFHGTTFTPTTSYTVATRTFATDPISGGAWTQDLLKGLEVCIRNTGGFAAINRISLISGTMTYTLATNWIKPEPQVYQEA